MTVVKDQIVHYVGQDGVTRDVPVIQQTGAYSARLNISTGTPGTAGYKEAYADAAYNEDRVTPNTFYLDVNESPVLLGG